VIRAARGVALLAALVGVASPAHADLGKDVDTLAKSWSSLGTVTVLPPRFYAAGALVPVSLPPASVDRAGDGCTTLAVLGALSTGFLLHLASDDESPGANALVGSVAGAAEIQRCGPARAELAELGIELRSPHGVLEVLSVESPGAVPDLREVLPHRDPGAVAESGDRTLPPLTRPPLASRAVAFERTLREEGASNVDRRSFSANEEGAGKVLLDLSPGCHWIGILGGPTPIHPDAYHDIDAELGWATGGVAATDRTDSPDANLLACTGERQPAILVFAGAGANAPMLLLHGARELPSGVPDSFGVVARARIGRALVEHHAAAPAGPPSYTSLGIGGITNLPIETDPGQCYLAALTPTEGSSSLVSLGVDLGATDARAHTDEPDSAVVLSFCTGIARRRILNVETHGSGVVWVLGLWPLAGQRLGEEEP